MAGATVPKTTVHEHRQLGLGKYEIRLAHKGVLAAPTSDLIPLKNRDQLEFGRLVAFGPDLAHQQGTFAFGKNIRHATLRTGAKRLGDQSEMFEQLFPVLDDRVALKVRFDLSLYFMPLGLVS